MVLNIVGGTYEETCEDPFWNEMYGSGFRAACALSTFSQNIKLHTIVGKDDLNAFLCMAKAIPVEVDVQTSELTCYFKYQHPLANPWLNKPRVQCNPLLVSAPLVLQFGMVEGHNTINAEKVVYDPQSPSNPQSFWIKGSTTNELIWVCNHQEAQIFTGCTELSEIKEYLFSREKANAAIVKMGALGAVLLQKGIDDFYVPSFITESVWPIGTGDIFSAVFAYNYLIEQESLTNSAYNASLATAFYSQSPILPIPITFESTSFKEFKNYSGGKKRVYIAAPFFNMSQRWLVDQVREQLLRLNLEVFSPFHDVGLGSPSEVVPKDLQAISKSNLVVGLIDGLDTGTIFEIGYARSIGIPVMILSETVNAEALTMLKGTNCSFESDFSTFIYKTFWEVCK